MWHLEDPANTKKMHHRIVEQDDWERLLGGAIIVLEQLGEVLLLRFSTCCRDFIGNATAIWDQMGEENTF